jgi:hypothetical protein
MGNAEGSPKAARNLPEPVVALATALGSKGYSPYYETKWLKNDEFWRVIMKHTIDASAVIVIWSRAALNSEWVQAEANSCCKTGETGQYAYRRRNCA